MDESSEQLTLEQFEALHLEFVEKTGDNIPLENILSTIAGAEFTKRDNGDFYCNIKVKPTPIHTPVNYIILLTNFGEMIVQRGAGARDEIFGVDLVARYSGNERIDSLYQREEKNYRAHHQELSLGKISVGHPIPAPKTKSTK